MPANSREEILRAVRAHQPPECALPSLEQNWITYSDRLVQFASVLEMIGGRCLHVADVAEANAKLQEISVYREAKQTVSLVEGIGRSNFDLGAVSDPHQLEPIDFAVMPGQFGVAENAAIWVIDRGLNSLSLGERAGVRGQQPNSLNYSTNAESLRALYFIVQHLALVISTKEIVDNMHQAYDRLRFDGTEFGAFIAGPSKTADIEQSLVIGAHGPRSLTVFCVDQI